MTFSTVTERGGYRAWPADGWYEVGTMTAQVNYSAITAWAKDRPDVNLNKTWALEVKGKFVTVHEYKWDENDDLMWERDAAEFGGMKVLKEEPRKVPL